MRGIRETVIFYLADISGYGVLDRVLLLHIVLGKTRRFTTDAENILQYQDLSITVGPGTYADDRNLQQLGNLGCQLLRHTFQQQQVSTGFL